MRATIIIPALFGAIALSNPIAKPDTVVVYTTITHIAGQADATPAPAAQGAQFYQEPQKQEVHPAPQPAQVQQPAPQAQTPASGNSGSTGSTGNTPSTGNSLADEAVAAHNAARAKHGAGPVTWDQGLADKANALASACVYREEEGAGYGQNIGAGISSIGEQITKGWYEDELKNYPFFGQEPNMSNFGGFGHMTQVVWKGTTKIGCAWSACPGISFANTQTGLKKRGSTNGFAVCNYMTPGNYANQYAANVQGPS